MTRRWFGLVTTLLLLHAPWQEAQGRSTSIGVFFSPDASRCDSSPPIGTFFDVFILVVPGTDAGNAGISGADFRVTGLDPGWLPTVTPSPQAVTTLGDPLDVFGCDIGFATCQSSGPILLYTIRCFMLPPLGARTLSVQHSNHEPHELYLAPLVWLCDAPAYTTMWVLGGQAFINGGSCTVSLESRSWSSIKQVFR